MAQTMALRVAECIDENTAYIKGSKEDGADNNFG